MIGIAGEVFLLIALLGSILGIFRTSSLKNFSTFIFIAIIVAFCLFITAHATDQFELLNVYLHSHSKKPMLYKIAGAWASHEGSLLLWCVLLAGYHTLFDRLFLKTQNAPFPFQHSSLFLCTLQCSFLLFLILACNPFDRLVEIPQEGQDLNPLLQDISLVIHPPHLYLGALGFVIPFVLSLSILMHGSLTPVLMRALRSFLLLAQTFLTIGIVLGCAWAYYELGWGGWWFFDPVENLALMPWLFGLMAVHMTLLTQKTGKYQRLSLILSALPFLQALMGLACVRSGMLNSVHAFGQDALRSIILWIIFGMWSCVSAILYMKRKHSFEIYSVSRLSLRTCIILISSICLFFAWTSLFLGTLSPVILSFFGTSIVLDNGFYAWTFIPVLGGALFLILFTPFTSFQNKKIFFWAYTPSHFKHAFPHIISHAGALFSVLGMVLSFVFGVEENIILKIKENDHHGPYHFQLESVSEKEGPNYHSIQGIFHVKTPYTEKKVTAEERLFWTQKDESAPSKQKGTRHVEAGLFTYDVFSQGLIMFATTDDKDVFMVRFILKPFIHFMWAGFFLVIVGLAFSTLQRFQKSSKRDQHPIL